ncbi:hypothetical protein ACTXT7_015439 [Hymenolepis weldensis]
MVYFTTRGEAHIRLKLDRKLSDFPIHEGFQDVETSTSFKIFATNLVVQNEILVRPYLSLLVAFLKFGSTASENE